VMILVDTLRRDHTPPGGHPFIIAPHVDQLASLGVNFSQAYGASSSTRPSVGSIFTGLQPKAHGAVRHATQGAGLFLNAPRLAEAFKKAGHKTAAVSSNAQVSPAFGFDWGFDIFLSSVWESQVSLKGVEQLQTLDEPFFLYLHYMGPHQPYEPASPWKGMYQGHHAHAEQDAYAEEITQEDHQIGAIIKELAQQGLLDRTIVWLVSDHGEEFWEHGWNGHGANLFEESTQAVSIVSAPNVLPIGATIDEPVTHVDIFPTLSEIFSWKKNKYAQGLSLMPLINHKSNDVFAGRPLFLHHGGGNSAQPHFSDKDAVLLNKKKMVWWNQKDEWELYDLPTDPGEKKNIYQPNDPFIKSTTPLLEKHLSECQSITSSIKMLDESLPSLTPQEVENLKAHGYMQK
jgi:arylsulfatase A-like enzyme